MIKTADMSLSEQLVASESELLGLLQSLRKYKRQDEVLCYEEELEGTPWPTQNCPTTTRLATTTPSSGRCT